jgi:hypothetical protein
VGSRNPPRLQPYQHSQEKNDQTGKVDHTSFSLLWLKGALLCLGQSFFTVAYRAVHRGHRCYRRGMVTVPSGSNRWQNSNLNLNSKKIKKINKNLQKIVHDL